MSWGVATQNGVSVSLASIVSLSCGATEAFSPASLFTSGVAGAWYDPSDYSTLYQDSVGTTPVTAVEQPVGLMLDKINTRVSYDPVTMPISGYDGGGATTIVRSGAVVTFTGAASGDGIRFTAITNTDNYAVMEIVASGSGSLVVYAGGTAKLITLTGTPTAYRAATQPNASTFTILRSNSAGMSASITINAVYGIRGNHASQATAASRPILRARYNLLTYSEQFDNAFWVKSGATVSANATTAPDETSTADLVTVTAQYGGVTNTYTGLIIGAQYTYSFYAKSNTGTNVLTLRNDTAGTNIGTYTPTSDWVRYSFTFTAVGTSAQLWPLQDRNASGFGSTYIWGADLRTGSSAGTYQRIAAATDYATAGFLPYLAFDGTDDSFVTNTITPSIDKAQVFAGVKVNGTASGMIIEHSANLNANDGTLYLMSGEVASADMAVGLRGTTTTKLVGASASVPITRVEVASFDIAGASRATEIFPRINGAAVSLTGYGAADAGTGNFLAYPIYIGRRGGVSIPFNGYLFSLIVRFGSTLTEAQITDTEAYVNQKTGAY